MSTTDTIWNIEDIPGFDRLSKTFCNKPIEAISTWDFIAAILLCGRNSGHEGPCDVRPPIEDLH